MNRLIVSMLSLLSSSALAGEGVLVLEAQGTARARLPAFDQVIRERVSSSGSKLLPKPALDFEGMKLAAGCLDEGLECLKTIADTIGARTVTLTRVDMVSDAVSVRVLWSDEKRGGGTVSLDFSDTGEATIQDVAEVVAGLVSKGQVPSGSLALAAKDAASLEGAVLTIDGESATLAGLSAVSPGRHRLAIRQSGFREFTWSGSVRPGKSVSIPVELEPEPGHTQQIVASTPGASPTPEIPGVEATAPKHEAEIAVVSPAIPPESGPSVLGFILLGAATVAGGVAIAEGVSVVGTEDDLDAYCAANDCAPDPCEVRADLCDAGEQAAALANVAWILAGAFAVGSVITFVLDTGDEQPISLGVAKGTATLGFAFGQ
ncbi:MAG: hypothetical protein HY791_24675 [Deltaproteobacteria bacterium]|nr:hypothetical protein [Deltaproteobacteria bacterium]